MTAWHQHEAELRAYRHREAGCGEVLVTSSRRWALMHELRGAPEPALNELLERLSPCDLVLIEGFKREAIPKLEVHRATNVGAELLSPHDTHVIAIATDVDLESKLPIFRLNEIEAIAGFVLEHAERIAAPPPSRVTVDPRTRPRIVIAL